MLTPHRALLGLALTLAGALAAEELQFNRDIRPILSENCFSCHGFDEKSRKAKLRLDSAADATRERKGVTPIVPGDLKKSAVWERIISDDPDEVMPPPKSHLSLSPLEKRKIRTWIEQGAKYEDHWAFVAPRRPALPADLRVSPVDWLVRKKLTEEGMTPSPEADRGMLIRRVSLDLTGLPPSAEEAAAFAADTRPDAYERLVDRLLASPHFGERLALDWLDAARYADTNGYSIDGGRHLWLWRDWVIQAFNDNKPYDRFLTEQLAGDLLPQGSDAELIATGFQRNNMNTHEGGTIPAENLLNYNADRVKTLGEAVLGLTLGCAQCHDHKFDPISQKDYYRIYAFFNTLDDRGLDGNAGVNSLPSALRKTILRTDEQPGLRQRVEMLRRRLAEPDAKVLTAWESVERARLAERKKGLKLYPVELSKISTPNSGGGFAVEGNKFTGLGKAAYDLLGRTPRTDEPITGLRLVFPTTQPPPPRVSENLKTTRAQANPKPGPGPKAPPGKPGPTMPNSTLGMFVLTAVDATADKVPGDQVNIHRLLRFSRVTASSWLPDFPAKDVRAFNNTRGWSPDATAGVQAHITLTLAEPITAETHPYLTTQVYFGHAGAPIVAEGQLFVITGHDDGTDLPDRIITLLGTPADQRDAAQQRELWDYCAAHSDLMQPVRTDLANAEERLKVLTEPFPTMVMNIAAKPRETFVLNRGDYAQPTVKVDAGTPAKLPPMPAGAPANRLGLAQWVTMKENPLTARVAVNRFWKLLFGTGLVSTPADFGFQGQWPSHPELLDLLAVDFVESGWDTKKLIRTIVTSATYRQTSRTTPALLEKDPSNRLLARGPRFRLPAELIRDQALKTSGLLVDQVGGPSVNPYTPFDLWREVSHYGSTPATAQTFVQDHGEKLYRRSMYTYWKRTAPPPSMVTFDAPNRELCTINRASTTTPLQSLVLLNDVQFVEAARAFAERILHRTGDDSSRLRWAFQEATTRTPSEHELAVIARTLARERARYAADPARAEAALRPGESPRDPALPPAEHAAWMQVATLLLNLSETVTRN